MLAALAVGIVCLVGAAAAAGGSSQDPLVTLSYLQQVVLPDVLEQTDQKVEDKAAELETALDGAIDDHSAQMEQALAGSGGTGSANYAVVTLSAGQVLEMDIGCEVMLRVGSASCDSPSSPGLIDSTGGTTLNDGGSLAVNHLYMATIEGRSVTADSDTVKVLVRGGYTIR